MNRHLAVLEPLVLRGNPGLSVLVGLAVFFMIHFLGRILKRRSGVRIGFIYQLFCVAIASLIALRIYGSEHPISLVLISLAELTGAFVITALVNRYYWEMYFVRSGKPPVPKFFSQVFSLIVVLAAFILIVTINYKQSGIISTVLTTGGVLALTIGLALQDLLGNIIAGFTIHFGRPFKLGDWLILDDKHVEVMEINWRSTRCRTNDDTYLDVPNASIIKQTVMNLYYPDNVHAIRVHVGLEYGTPPNLAKACLLRAASQVTGVLLHPVPTVYLVKFGESSIDYEIKAFISDHSIYPAVMDTIRTNVWYELKRHRLEIPFPQRVLQIQRPDRKPAEDYSTQIMAALKKQESFSFLTNAQLRHLTEGCLGVFYGAGERIIRQGDSGESMFVILSGQVQVLVDGAGFSTEVAQLKEGSCFGEMSLLTGENRSATIVAAKDSLIVELPKENMCRLLKENARVVEKLGELLAERKLLNEGQIAENTVRSKRMAMARSLKASFLGRLKVFFEL